MIVDEKSCRTAHSEGENSQIGWFSVLTYTIFGHSAMDFQLSKHPSGITSFNTIAKRLQTFSSCEIGNSGDLLVWNLHDNEKYMHQACFDSMVKKQDMFSPLGACLPVTSSPLMSVASLNRNSCHEIIDSIIEQH